MTYNDLKKGMKVRVDDGFSCITAGEYVVHMNYCGFFIHCHDGLHYLDGQINDKGILIGIKEVKDTFSPEIIEIIKELGFIVDGLMVTCIFGSRKIEVNCALGYDNYPLHVASCADIVKTLMLAVSEHSRLQGRLDAEKLMRKSLGIYE